ncbi:TetR family transcriptional regulator [Tamaricihabitans halophyticus]|uniref:TetR family transcriptional regulator n=1 Tax=Tamaricihabitans halophyticus TaxID=1262583 RepID=A0A4R2R3S6_9PSEU|nr:TetR/AcrR family transcriptional regulator [Tamaricihabitans halophyticus]TCP56288.1 TetR family transcriptional regulator [Tamaricihabitans halophyticus]
MQDVLTPAARRILDVAAELFYENGIHAVGVDRIAAAAGVTKKTLYDRFGAKDALVERYLRERDERWRDYLYEVLDEASRSSPVRRVLLVFDALQDWMDEKCPRGCAFVNAYAELPDDGHPGRTVIAEQKQWLFERIHELARATGARAPRKLAEELAVLLEGAMVVRTAGVIPDGIAVAKRTARKLVAAATAG